MKIEELFKRCHIDFPKLREYGFLFKNKRYYFSKKIMDDTLEIQITISKEETFEVKVFDLSFGEEYTNYKREGELGEFASKVKEEVLSLFIDIQKKCTTPCYFQKDQANRIAALVEKKYQDTPQFLWEEEPHGVFKNEQNGKWYGLIMDINRKKLDGIEKEVEILNVKLSPKKILSYQEKKGFYPAYHMNKKNWITILLDDTLSDEEIMECLEESHQYTEEKKEWLIPSNPYYYDIESAFAKEDTILWKQPLNIHLNDIIYLYVGQPYSAILYQCQVIELNIPYSYQTKKLSMKTVMRIQLLRTYPKTAFPLEKLKTYGVTTVRGPRFVPSKLSKELKKEVH